MTPQKIQGKGILVKLLEKSIEILLKKECKKIGNLKIDITSNSIQIIRGELQKINISIFVNKKKGKKIHKIFVFIVFKVIKASAVKLCSNVTFKNKNEQIIRNLASKCTLGKNLS